MSSGSKMLLLCVLILGLAGGAAALLVHRVAAHAGKTETATTTQTSTQTPSRSSQRNLSLQPEASKLARNLGARFLARKNTSSVVIATLTVDSEIRTMRMTRRQDDDGENVEIAVDGSPGPLSWDAKRGGVASGREVIETDRTLIERLVFDSPDQFVLMQFRGASYYTLARAVRPADASEGYDGPLWTVVRVDDPEQDEAKRPVSRWRLYYLNTATGLIDRIESEAHGQRIVAEISSWTEQHGEKFPAQIVWTRDGQTFMQYNLKNFSLSQN